jgi:mono/diheme cytochrome c family protein
MMTNEGQRNDVADSKESPMTMLSRRISALACCWIGATLAAVAPAQAADRVTYYDDVAPILRASCQSCHQPVGRNMGALVAPMSLMTYEEARPYARAIARKVQAREMPPWFAEASSRTSAS